MVTPQFPPPPPPPAGGFSAKQVFAAIIISTLVAILGTGLLIKWLLFPSPFTPVELSSTEQQQLEAKLDRLSTPVVSRKGEISRAKAGEPLNPEKYSEAGADRTIRFTEREVNSLIATNTELADKLAIDLAEDMISLKLLVPLDPDFPIMGGQTLKVKAGAELAYRAGKPVVKLLGVSLMGVPMPNAWLGGIKNMDLIEEFGSQDGFWQVFADGVASIRVAEGNLEIELKE